MWNEHVKHTFRLVRFCFDSFCFIFLHNIQIFVGPCWYILTKAATSKNSLKCFLKINSQLTQTTLKVETTLESSRFCQFAASVVVVDFYSLAYRSWDLCEMENQLMGEALTSRPCQVLVTDPEQLSTSVGTFLRLYDVPHECECECP